MRTAKMLEQQANTLRLEIEALLREFPDLADDEILRADMLEGETDIREIVTSVNRMMEDAKALRDGTVARLDELASRKGRFQQRMDFGRELIRKILESAQIRKLELAEVTVSLRNNAPALMGEHDPESMPSEFCKVTRTIDRKKVREALEAGRDVEGFYLSNAAPSLMVKVK
jgi:hypothetical protein